MFRDVFNKNKKYLCQQLYESSLITLRFRNKKQQIIGKNLIHFEYSLPELTGGPRLF